MEQIIIRLKQVRAIASKNPLDKALGKIGERLFSYSFSWPCSAGEEDNLNWEEQKKGILYSHRRELVALYDFFEWWVTKQSEVPYRMYYGFNIIGP